MIALMKILLKTVPGYHLFPSYYCTFHEYRKVSGVIAVVRDIERCQALLHESEILKGVRDIEIAGGWQLIR